MNAQTTFRSGGAACEQCASIVCDVLSGETAANAAWTTLTSEYASLSYTLHHGGIVQRLFDSATSGCQLCALFFRQLSVEGKSLASETYSVFVWHKVPPQAHAYIVAGAADKYVLHISQWKSPACIAFYGRRRKVMSSSASTGQGVLSLLQRPHLPRLPSPHHDSPDMLRLARAWLEECRETHQVCTRSAARLPKRIVRLISVEGELKISLYLSERELHDYSILSYSWGESDRIVCQQGRKNVPINAVPHNGTYVIEQRRSPALDGQPMTRCWDPSDIPLTAFPETQKDAIIIAHSLGFQYIWLDSLCIVQDDDADWADNVAELCEIYSNAAFVISAADSKDSMKGILVDIPNDKLGLGTWNDEIDGPTEIYAGPLLPTLDLERSIIASRAWVFQERLVSVASLHYTDQGLVWECVNGIKAAHDQALSSAPFKAQWRDLLKQKQRGTAFVAKQRPHSRSPSAVWYDWICAYSARTFYSATDKFPAIAGVAREFAMTFGLTYVAGLWKEDFLSGLAWRRHNRTPTLVRYRQDYVAPSWSWGSVQGRLEHRGAYLLDSLNASKGPSLKVIDCSVEEVRTLSDGSRSYEHVREGAKITVLGVLQQIVVDVHRHPGVRQRPFQESGVSQGFRNNENVICMIDELDTSVQFESIERYYQCWCIRIASYKTGSREGDMFLLLQKDASSGEFHRVGFAETDPYHNIKDATPNSGVFEKDPLPVTIVIV